MVLPYLKGLVIIKCGFFYLSCGSIVYSVFLVIIFVDLFRFLTIILEPEAITDTRIRQLRNRSISEYLIKWRKLSAEIPLGKMSLLYRSIQSYSSIVDNTCLKGRGMLSHNIGSLPLNWGILD
jgi:hypothetical protein